MEYQEAICNETRQVSKYHLLLQKTQELIVINILEQ
jgi:hypothetical protein